MTASAEMRSGRSGPRLPQEIPAACPFASPSRPPMGHAGVSDGIPVFQRLMGTARPLYTRFNPPTMRKRTPPSRADSFRTTISLRMEHRTNPQSKRRTVERPELVTAHVVIRAHGYFLPPGFSTASSNSLPDLGGPRADKEKRKFSGCGFGTDACDAAWLRGPRPVLEGQTVPEAKNTFCPLSLAQRWPLRSDVRLPAAPRPPGLQTGCCNMLYLGLHLRPDAPSAAAPHRGLPAARRRADGADGTCVGPSDSTLLGTRCAENGRL